FHLAPSPAGLSPPSLHDALPIFVELAAVVDELPVAEEGSFGRAAGGLAGSLHARLARREPVGPGLTIHLTLDVGLRLAAPLAAGLTAGAAGRRGPLSLAAGFTAAGEGRLAAGCARAGVGGCRAR